MTVDTQNAGGRTHWLSTIDVSELLGINLRDVWELIDSGALSGDRVGRTTLVRRSELDAYLRRQARRRTPAPDIDLTD